jgi:hypothetical protein
MHTLPRGFQCIAYSMHMPAKYPITSPLSISHRHQQRQHQQPRHPASSASHPHRPIGHSPQPRSSYTKRASLPSSHTMRHARHTRQPATPIFNTTQHDIADLPPLSPSHIRPLPSRRVHSNSGATKSLVDQTREAGLSGWRCMASTLC